mgnify:CR=1 FL=1
MVLLRQGLYSKKLHTKCIKKAVILSVRKLSESELLFTVHQSNLSLQNMMRKLISILWESSFFKCFINSERLAKDPEF